MGFGVLNPATFTPFPKNPVIGAFFREIHRADELGSGMRKMMKYGKAYGGDDPQMVEGDVFRIIVKVPEFGRAREESGASGTIVTAPVLRLLELLISKGTLGNAEILAELGLKSLRRMHENYLAPALKAGLIEYTIPDKPNSRLQKYRLTAKGRAFLKNA